MVQDTWAVAFRVFLAFALALLGGVISSLTPMTHEKLCRLISLAAGTLLGVTLFSIIPESYSALPIWQLALGLASGYLLFWLISRYVFHVCPACAASHFDEATTHRFSEIATAMVIALGLHSTMDGLALAIGKESTLTGGLDLSLLLAICVHKVPEGLALCALLLAAGLGRSDCADMGCRRRGDDAAGRSDWAVGCSSDLRALDGCDHRACRRGIHIPGYSRGLWRTGKAQPHARPDKFRRRHIADRCTQASLAISINPKTIGLGC